MSQETGLYGRDDNSIQRGGAYGADLTMLNMLWLVARSFEIPVCPHCGAIEWQYLWGQHRVRCLECDLEGEPPKSKVRIEAKGGFTHYDLEEASGLEYGVSLGPRRRDFADKPIKQHGSGRSPSAGSRYIVETGFVRAIPSRHSFQTVYMAFEKMRLIRRRPKPFEVQCPPVVRSIPSFRTIR
jgi:hypothetical protein